MQKGILKSITVCAFAALLAGCPGVNLKPGAEQVKLTNSAAPKSCQLVGQVVSRDINGATQPFTSHEHLQNEEIKTLKNQAINLGANLIVVTSHTTTYTGDGNSRVNVHSMAGNAYRCSANVLQQTPLLGAAEFSDIH